MVDHSYQVAMVRGRCYVSLAADWPAQGSHTLINELPRIYHELFSHDYWIWIFEKYVKENSNKKIGLLFILTLT